MLTRLIGAGHLADVAQFYKTVQAGEHRPGIPGHPRPCLARPNSTRDLDATVYLLLNLVEHGRTLFSEDLRPQCRVGVDHPRPLLPLTGSRLMRPLNATL